MKQVKISENPTSPQFYRQVASPRMKNSSKNTCSASGAMEVDTQVLVPNKVSVRRVK